MKIWITKYALTQGIIEAECEGIMKDGWCHAFWTNQKGIKCNDFMHPRDFETNRMAAIKNAEEMRQKKIESLKKQIEKLEEMTFE